ncbi:MAG: hypothetical protein ABIN08_11360 [Caldimonas sp.]
MHAAILSAILLLGAGAGGSALAQASGLPSSSASTSAAGLAGSASSPASSTASVGPGASPSVPFVVVGDAIPEPLGGVRGDAARGRALVANRQVGLCLLCHAGPIPEERFQGNLAPDLAGAGSR